MSKHLAVAALLVLSANCLAGEWHHPLYLGNGGCWRQRVKLTVRNDLDREVAGEPVAVPIGKGVGEADLLDAQAEGVRVCDATGTEMLFSIAGAQGEAIVRGPIQTASTITIPVECAAKGTTEYYIYFDNPDAWAVPDLLEARLGVVNGGMESGTGDAPVGWTHDEPDAQHQTSWVREKPRSGARCLKTVVAEGAEPTWIASRQGAIHITGGAKYTMRAWVKAEGVKGFAGWYIHVGNENNPMLIAPMLSGGEGTYDWKQVSAEFIAPPQANRADLGTVLRGTGTAWFDDVTLECQDAPKLSATAAEREKLEVRELVRPEGGLFRRRLPWDHRTLVKVTNLSDQARSNVLVHVDLSALPLALRGVELFDGPKAIRPCRLQDSLVFEGDLPARTVRGYYAHLWPSRQPREAEAGSYGELVASARNLARNPSFEAGDKLPADWAGGTEGQAPPGTAMGFDQPTPFGRRCVKISIPHDAKPAWTGWRQDVPTEPGRTYLYAAWLKCEDVRDGTVQLHAHYRNAGGQLCKTAQYTSAGVPISGTTDWTLMSGMFRMPDDIATFQLHLTMLATGTVWHDGVLLAEVVPGTLGRIETRPMGETSAPVVWPVNPIVKVFQHDLPPLKSSDARITAARNEKEPLQVAVRSGVSHRNVQVEVAPPTNAQGAKLTDVQVAVVGYVPIDHPTNYYQSLSPSWHRKYPTSPGGCDGWPGMWPDPLIPRSTFDLQANTTQPVWITVSVPKDAAPGDYLGKVKLHWGGRKPAELPFTVHVWDFTLPDASHMAAIYDVRLGGRWNLPGKTSEETRNQFWRFMADHRVCPDKIQPDPVIRYENGNVTADFTEFDKAAEYYFNVLKLPHTYTPWYFYLFGWGMPPDSKFGEQPYEGQPPYEGVDRSRLRPQFKRAYQACLKTYWDHMKQKGWDSKCVLYISDEPFFSQPQIVQQMKALCQMIHDVDPSIPIYSSTWHHVPEWDGSLNVWGIGHYGVVSPEKMAQLRGSGSRLWFTTDGHMCTDTPYCAIERLLPHYGFQYGVEAYEFWGITWLTYNPYEFGWHAYIHQTDQPGKWYWVRYPNGDGFLAYPGATIGHDGPVSSVRLEQAREGVEDYEYLHMLRELAAKAKAAGKATPEADAALQAAGALVSIPNAGGRYSSRILPNPDAVILAKQAAARAIEALSR